MPASAVTASCIDGNPYVEHHDEIVIVVAASLCRRVRNCYLLQAQPVRKVDPNGGEGVYRNGRIAVDVVQNDGGIRPEVCKPIFVGTDPDLYIRRWAAEKLRDGNGITKYYMIKLHY